MTQFKEKGERQEFVTAGLFTYPVLMAGDILLYQTDIVPIGDDQRQHLELARDIAERFNARFGETFVVPEGVYPEIGARIMDLQEPTKKMSTTGGTAQGTVLMLDPPDVIRKKIKTRGHGLRAARCAAADDKPGVTNLIEIMAVATGESLGGDRGALRRRRLRRSSRGTSPRRSSRCSSRSSSRYEELRADAAELRRLLARRRREGRAPRRRPTLEAMYERDGLRARAV